jgi:hypothetical protein
VVVQVWRVHRDSEHVLRVASAAHDGDLLERDIDREGIRDLVLDAFESRYLPVDPGGTVLSFRRRVCGAPVPGSAEMR